MSPTWTPEQVFAMMAVERAKNQSRMEAIRIVRDAIQMADLWYVNRYAELKREMDIGLIGPEKNTRHKVNYDVWLAGHVKEVLLRELHDESPRIDDDETNQ